MSTWGVLLLVEKQQVNNHVANKFATTREMQTFLVLVFHKIKKMSS
jgi:hypothetical protein